MNNEPGGNQMDVEKTGELKDFQVEKIQVEDFEKAAQLRDKIREVEKLEKKEPDKKEKKK